MNELKARLENTTALLRETTDILYKEIEEYYENIDNELSKLNEIIEEIPDE